MNANIRYQADQADVWSTPAETLWRGSGDCEDFAILKRSILMGLGVPDEKLFFTIVKIPSVGHHAVLVVDTEEGFLVLDCFNTLSLPDKDVREYTPMFSYSGSGCWIHGKRKPVTTT